MSRLISDVLGATEPHFTHTLMEWERLSGNPSHDVRLITDIKHRRRQAADHLGLANDDTTARELYFALRSRSLSDSEKFEATLNLKQADSVEKMVSAAIKYVEALPYPREVWVAKQSFIKSAIKANPPKKLMKLLGLRSIDSVIKRANINEFLALAYVVENEAWVSKLHAAYKKLRAGDLQPASSLLIVISPKNLEKLSRTEHDSPMFVRINHETGSILIHPPEKRFAGDGLSLVLAVIEAMSELRIYSAYFRHISVKSDVGLKFSQSLSQGLPSLPSSAHTIGWRDLQRYLATDKELFDEIRQPHFQNEDLRAPTAVEALVDSAPYLEFWLPLQGVFHGDGRIVISCHFIDVLAGAVNDLEPEQLPLDYMRSHLWQELGAKYLSEKHLQSELLKNVL